MTQAIGRQPEISKGKVRIPGCQAVVAYVSCIVKPFGLVNDVLGFPVTLKASKTQCPTSTNFVTCSGLFWWPRIKTCSIGAMRWESPCHQSVHDVANKFAYSIMTRFLYDSVFPQEDDHQLCSDGWTFPTCTAERIHPCFLGFVNFDTISMKKTGTVVRCWLGDNSSRL